MRNNRKLKHLKERHKNTLSKIIEYLSGKPISRISNDMFIILEDALAEYYYTDSLLPNIVHNSVEKAKKISKKKSGFINAVLRKLPQDKQLEKIIKNISSDKDISLILSFPEWIIKEAKKSFTDYIKILENLNRNAPITLRINPIRKNEVFKELKENNIPFKSGNLPYSIFILSSKKLTELSSWKNGHIYYQDEASQLTGEILREYSGKTVLDLCASPGGKSTYIAMLDKNISITSSDLSERLYLIKENIKRMGLSNINIVKHSEITGIFHTVLIDAPCSSLGTIRRHPEIKWNKRLKDLDKYSSIQLSLLEKAYNHTAEGGTIIYSVCTFTQKETKEVCEKFIKSHKDIIEEKIHKNICSTEFDFPGLVKPGTLDMDGFFISVFRKSKNSLS